MGYGTAAASDNFFGCGDCVILTAPAGGKMIVRVNNQCPGSSNPACREAHFDIAVPGFDNLQYSVNNQSMFLLTIVTQSSGLIFAHMVPLRAAIVMLFHLIQWFQQVV